MSTTTFDLTKDRYHVCYRLGLNSIFFADSSPFSNKGMRIYSNVIEEDLIILRKLVEQQKDQQALGTENSILKQAHGLE